MKNMYPLKVFVGILCFTFLTFHLAFAQPSSGVGAGFGVDGGLYSGKLEFPTPSQVTASDDWFKGTGTGINIIDLSDSADYVTLLQTPGNQVYEARMSKPQSSVTDGKIWIDGLYARDQFGGTGYTDGTAYVTASKNGQDPAVWAGGTANVLGKNDLIDVGGHMRRDGESLETGDLWFFGVAIIAEPGGASYLDFEFFIQQMTYSPSAGFSSGGPDLGHTSFTFSNDWKISRIGDFIFSTDVSSSGMESVDMRIWVKYTDYQYILANSPVNLDFTFAGTFDGPYTGSPYGYAKIVPKSSNYGQTNATTTTAPPWGHKGTKFNTYSSTQVGELALMELGVNLTEFGIDHATIEGINVCDFPIHTFLVKTRSSASFTAQLKDFSGPYGWGRTTIDAVIIGNTVLSCEFPTTELAASPVRDDATYLWSTLDGNVVDHEDSSHVHVSQPGTYRLDMWVLLDDVPGGCQADYAEVTVGYDPSKPFFDSIAFVAQASCSGSNGSINTTVYGGTPPFTYLWSNGATTLNVSGLSSGTYTLTVTDDEACTFVDSAVVIAPTPIVITPTQTNLLCFGATNGSVSLSVTGTATLTYSWSNGSIANAISNLTAGTYTVTVTDGNQCTATANYTITQPTIITRSLLKTNSTNNLDPGDGSIDLTVSGGTPGYTYVWAKTKDLSTTNPYATTQNLDNLTRGVYTVTITDANSCTSTISTSLFEPEICDDDIDNDGDGLTDCEDSECIPAAPGVITPSDASPCVGDALTYSVVNDPSLTGYSWTVPSNASISAGQGTNSITVTWNNDQAGQVCVKANALGCLSSPTCLLVSPDKTPNAPSDLDVINN